MKAIFNTSKYVKKKNLICFSVIKGKELKSALLHQQKNRKRILLIFTAKYPKSSPLLKFFPSKNFGSLAQCAPSS